MSTNVISFPRSDSTVNASLENNKDRYDWYILAGRRKNNESGIDVVFNSDVGQVELIMLLGAIELLRQDLLENKP